MVGADVEYIFSLAYYSGVYGWYADIYEYGNIAIVTGYAPFGDIEVTKEICTKYEKIATQILYCEREISYKERCEDMEQLLGKFIREVII